MKTKLRIGVVLAAVAGCACSVAYAQSGPGGRHAPLKVHRVTQSAMAPEPTWIEYNGVRHTPNSGSGNPTDDNFNIYQNGVGTTTHNAWFAASDPPDHFGCALDDISFAGSYGAGPGGRLVNRLTFNITTTALLLQAATTPVEVEVVLWKTLNIAGTPVVNTNADPTIFRMSVPAPAAGWALNTIYFQQADLTGFSGGGWATGGESFAIEMRYFLPGGTTANGLYHPDISVGFEGTGVENGTSADRYWADNNGGTPNGIMFEPGAAGDELNFGGAAGTLANFAIALQANVTLPTGACCLQDGSCNAALNVLTCAGLSGVYRGDGAGCATANCPPPGACCTSSGTCTSVTSAACAASGGIYRGDGSCCAVANCPVGFDAGPPQTCTFNGAAPSYLGLISGTSAPNSFRWSFQPFSLSRAATVTEIDTDFFVNIAFSNVNWIILNRHTDSLPNPVYRAPVAADVVASGTDVFNSANLVSDPRTAGVLFTVYPITGLSVALPAGDYYVCVYGDNPATPGADTSLAWFTNAQAWPAIGAAPIYNFDSSGEMLWRADGAVPYNFTAPYRPTNIGVDPAPTFGPNPQDAHYRFTTSFTIKTAPPPALCYANCDHSSTAPCLNVLDFSCFLNAFAAGSCYANCDHSTTPPVLNVLDFSCFLNSFAAGCSNC